MSKKIIAEYEAERWLSKYVPVAKSFLAKKEKDLEKAKAPAVLKIISKQALHKSDIGGVAVVEEKDEMIPEYRHLLTLAKRRKIKLEGILVQEFLKGKEIIIGLKKDTTFGHVIAFGIGGKYVEILRDISFRVCPITEKDAEQMIGELKMKQLLYGARREKGVNMKLLKSVLVKVSKIPAKMKNVEELDINPFIINEKTGKVADARAVFS